MILNKSYQPINCGLYDYLEAAATIQREVEIVYLDSGESKLLRTKVKDLYIKEKVEYLVTTEQKEIRLDRIISFGGQDFTG